MLCLCNGKPDCICPWCAKKRRAAEQSKPALDKLLPLPNPPRITEKVRPLRYCEEFDDGSMWVWTPKFGWLANRGPSAKPLIDESQRPSPVLSHKQRGQR